MQDDRPQCVQFVFVHIEHEFVVHLQDHAGTEIDGLGSVDDFVAHLSKKTNCFKSCLPLPTK